MREDSGSGAGCRLPRAMQVKRKPPSLVDLCVRTAIDNLRYLGDVGETSSELLEKILPHCTVDQLIHVEKCSTGRDLSPVTDKLWKNFYEKQFGSDSTNLVIKRMKEKKVSCKWMKLYEAKLKDVEEAQVKSIDRLRERYKEKSALKQSRQIKICTKVPPSSNKRRFGGWGSYDVSNFKSNLMKKSKVDVLKSREVKNIAAMKKIGVQRNHSISSLTKPLGLSGEDSTSASKVPKPLKRRF